MDKEYNVKEVSEMLCVTEETIRRLMRSGKLKGVRNTGRGGNVIRESDVADFLRSGNVIAKRYVRLSGNEELTEESEPEVIENDEPDINARISELEISVKLLTAELNYLKAIRDIMEGV